MAKATPKNILINPKTGKVDRRLTPREVKLTDEQVLEIRKKYRKGDVSLRKLAVEQEAMKPTQITPEVYLTEHGKTINPKTYESLGRRVRKICEKYWQDGLLIKDDKTKGYRIDFL